MKAEETSFKIGRLVVAVIVTAVILLFAIILLVFVLNNDWLDEKIFVFLSDQITQTRTNFFKDVTILGNHRFLIPANLILITLFLAKKKYWWAIRVTVVALSSLGLMSLLKNLIQRVRPPEPMVDGITNFGFPSGHALMSIAFYGLLIVITIQFITNKIQRWIIISFLIVLILLVGFSRIYLRVHYTTDVIAGWSVGILWLVTSLFILDRIKAKRNR